jgi:hypothetical protein
MFLYFEFEACVLIVYANAVCRVADMPENTVMPWVGHLKDLVLLHMKRLHTSSYCISVD